jgi:hypothetical protein
MIRLYKIYLEFIMNEPMTDIRMQNLVVVESRLLVRRWWKYWHEASNEGALNSLMRVTQVETLLDKHIDWKLKYTYGDEHWINSWTIPPNVLTILGRTVRRYTPT